ncbi:hypothetical protein DVA67_015795 [Solirubrobacter sp. CPCC 204708]|uniref:Plastocyanin/azurin family copper-binding protein n=1 Tax=Solirubrobacter deserti TaxID=2282478 RepID=A0ABT4RN92_9ACTN|nr:plastocyanin/azurin family copper-binding protein [Solirubrobacter deserti]MBE2317446.1 hypothetical protein [Solirubrobacter deserti]MDA0140028.1 plastocyanin/azurin family copper-binding protein [Solirubrobacter deserti]
MAVVRLGAVIIAVFAGAVAIAQAQTPQASIDIAVTDNLFTPGSSTLALNGKLKFSYEQGNEAHNVRFERDGVVCTQTAGDGAGPTGRVLPATSEDVGWAGECTFSQPGVYQFVCDDHVTMTGKVTVANADGSLPSTSTPTPTPTATVPAGGANPPAGGGPTDTTGPAPGAATAPTLTVAASQRGQAVAGSIKGGSAGAAVTVETLAALKARAKPTRVGRATYSVAAGATKKFSLALNAKGKAALNRLGRLKVTVRFTVEGTTTTRTVTLRPAARSKASIARKRVTVNVGDNVFTPKTATVARGGTVTWRWVGKHGHDVVGSGFKSKVMTKGTFKRTFTKNGTVSYACTLHRGMTGTIRVR